MVERVGREKMREVGRVRGREETILCLRTATSALLLPPLKPVLLIHRIAHLSTLALTPSNTHHHPPPSHVSSSPDLLPSSLALLTCPIRLSNSSLTSIVCPLHLPSHPTRPLTYINHLSTLCGSTVLVPVPIPLVSLPYHL